MGGTLKPSVVCVGANLETEVALEMLHSAGVKLSGLVTLPARSVGGVSDYRDLHPFCEGHGIAVVDTEDINASKTVDTIRSLRPDYIFVLGWSQLLREELLSVPSGFVVGSHPTPLPQRRGRAPVPWTILEDHRSSAVTLFRMEPGVDDGPILQQRWFDIPEGAYARTLYDLIVKELGEGYRELYLELEAGRWEEQPQDTARASYRAKRQPADGHIDFSRPAELIDRLVRAVSEPYPGAYTYLEDSVVHVWRAKAHEGPNRQGVPGQILACEGEWLTVQAGDQPIAVSSLTRDGQAQPAGEFRIGAVFGYRVEDALADLRRRVAALERMLGDD